MYIVHVRWSPLAAPRCVVLVVGMRGRRGCFFRCCIAGSGRPSAGATVLRSGDY